MYLLSWNVDQLGASKRLAAVANAIASTAPDIVTLQEVRSQHATKVAEALQGCGLQHVRHSHDPPPCSDREAKKAYHCVIASRWPLVDLPGGDAWRCPVPFPEVLGRVMVKAPAGEIDVFTAHIPHGSGHGWKKIDTFETLALALRSGSDSARILTGDFNEPKLFLSSGQFLTFRGKAGQRGWRDVGPARTAAWQASCGLVRRRPVGPRGHVTPPAARCIPGPPRLRGGHPRDTPSDQRQRAKALLRSHFGVETFRGGRLRIPSRMAPPELERPFGHVDQASPADGTPAAGQLGVAGRMENWAAYLASEGDAEPR